MANLDPEAERSRRISSRPDESRPRKSLIATFNDNVDSFRYLLLVAGLGAFFVGVLIFVFIRDLSSAGQATMSVGLGLLLLSAVLSWRQIGRALFGRRGRYGVNTAVVVVAFIFLVILGNFFLYWLGNRDNPQGWLRIDVTANNQFDLSEQTVQLLNGLKGPIQATVFLPTDTPEGPAAVLAPQDIR